MSVTQAASSSLPMEPTGAPLGVLLMAYGTPRHTDEVEAYYTDIRRGRPPTKELLDDLLRRYQAIGGLSPLNAITEAEAHGLENALNADGGRGVRVYLGMKHTHPFIGDAVREMAADGIEEAVTLVLAPHYSTRSVAEYQRAAQEAVEETGKPSLLHVDYWYDNQKFLRLIADRVQARLADFDKPQEVMVVFSAHSLPEKILAAGDPYQDQLHATGHAVANALGLKHYMFGWQSAGRTADKWLGPDILDVLRDLAPTGRKNVLLCPVGFVSDHLEVLYDVDIEAKALARELGIHLERTENLNADPAFIEVLRDVVRKRQAAAGTNS